MVARQAPLERTIVGHIVTMLRARGAYVIKTHGGIMQVRGIPDLLVCYRGVFIGIEVKRPGKHPTPIQQTALDEINEADGCGITATDADTVAAYLDRLDWRIDGGRSGD